MKIIRIRTLTYPSIYSYQSTLVMQLEIENQDEQAFLENSDFISILEKSCAAQNPVVGQMRKIRTTGNALAQTV